MGNFYESLLLLCSYIYTKDTQGGLTPKSLRILMMSTKECQECQEVKNVQFWKKWEVFYFLSKTVALNAHCAFVCVSDELSLMQQLSLVLHLLSVIPKTIKPYLNQKRLNLCFVDQFVNKELWCECSSLQTSLFSKLKIFERALPNQPLVSLSPQNWRFLTSWHSFVNIIKILKDFGVKPPCVSLVWM